MPDTHKPRAGSMQFWPRKRAKREVARVRQWADSSKAQLSGFAGYKVGMTHIVVENVLKTKGKNPIENLAVPVSIIECPPLKVASVRFYKKTLTGLKVVKEVFGKVDKELSKRLAAPKKEGSLDSVKPEEYDEVRVNVYTQPKMTGLGKKKPEFFEVAVGGNKEEAFNYAKENLGKEIAVSDVFSPGQLVDIHAVTTGKGFQGSVKRFGIKIRAKKSEKTKRGPGSIAGGWKAQGHMMYRVPMSGQMGYHTRTEYNKQIFVLDDDVSKINPKGGFVKYGEVKTTYLLIKGSVGGPRKRLVRFCLPIRKDEKVKENAPKILSISTESRQR